MNTSILVKNTRRQFGLGEPSQALIIVVCAILRVRVRQHKSQNLSQVSFYDPHRTERQFCRGAPKLSGLRMG